MKKKTLALVLAMIVGVICIGNFIYKTMKFGRVDYVILLAGILIMAFGISNYYRRVD